jgi:putative membrane protein
MTEDQPFEPPAPVRSLFSGLAMGAADAVPGISGGTIALLLGFYGSLLRALSVMLGSPRTLRSPEGRAGILRALRFLIPLGVGVLAAYWLATKLLVGATEDPGWLRRTDTAPYLYGFFSGLVVLSAWRVWSRVPHPRGRDWAAVLVGAVVAFAFAGLPHLQGEPPPWALLPGGAAAISVMLLPGVSGSLLLVILGQYTTVSAAVHDRDLQVLAIFMAGLFIGASLFVPLLRRLLERHPRPTLSLLTGLMLGSTRALWPWKSQYDPKAGELANHLGLLDAGTLALGGVMLATVAGGGAVLLLEAVERRAAARSQGDSDLADGCF